MVWGVRKWTSPTPKQTAIIKAAGGTPTATPSNPAPKPAASTPSTSSGSNQTVTVNTSGGQVTTTNAELGKGSNNYGDIEAAKSPAAARARILKIYENRKLDPPDAAKLAAMVNNVMTKGPGYFDTIRAEPLRYLNVTAGGLLSDDDTLATVDTDGDGKPDASAADAARIEAQKKDRENSREYIRGLLKDYGFKPEAVEELMTAVTEWVAKDWSENRIMQGLRELGAYKDRFKGMEGRAAKGLNAITENEYLQLERGYNQVLRKLGMPKGFYDDSSDYVNFITNDVSVVELEERVTDGYMAAKGASEEVRKALKEFYGISESSLAAYYLNPEKGMDAIQREFRAAQIGGAAEQAGFGGLGRGRAERLESLNISEGQAREGFGSLAEQQNLFKRGFDVGGTVINEDEQLDAMFTNNAKAMERIRRQRERRLAQFQGTVGGAAFGQEGVTGLQSATS